MINRFIYLYISSKYSFSCWLIYNIIWMWENVYIKNKFMNRNVVSVTKKEEMKSSQ